MKSSDDGNELTLEGGIKIFNEFDPGSGRRWRAFLYASRAEERSLLFLDELRTG